MNTNEERHTAIQSFILLILVVIFGFGFFSFVLMSKKDKLFFRPTCNDIEKRSDISSILPENLKYLNKNKKGVYCSSVTH